MLMFDPLYLIMVAVPGLVLSLFATLYTKSTFARYARVASSRGMHHLFRVILRQ